MGLNWNEIKSRALLFSKTWADACNEDSQAKPFWIDFFEIFGITNKRVATFELNVKKLGGAHGFVDLFWPGVLLVEHKSRGKNLDDAVDQAVGYLHNLPERDLPQLVVVCDFARFRVRRLATGETVEFALQHLHKHVKLFGLLAGYKVQDIRSEDPVNIKAAERMGRLHDALKASGYQGHALEVLLVRLLFCLFADDTGIFQPAQSFRDFVEERTAPDGSDLGPRLGQLFQVLNTHESQRSKNIDEQLGQFAYINGRLFEETLPMADFSTAMREALLDACALDWSAISPAIFGSLFQSIMDEKARRNLGAHYTSEANILKLIKPLFLDELHAEFERVKGNSRSKDTDRSTYARDLRDRGVSPRTSLKAPAVPDAAKPGKVSTTAKPRNKSDTTQRKYLVPTGFVCNAGDRNLRMLFREMQRTPIDQHEFANAYLLRAFVERVMTLYLKKVDRGFTAANDQALINRCSQKLDPSSSQARLKALRTAASKTDASHSLHTLGAVVHAGMVMGRRDLIFAWTNWEHALELMLTAISTP